MAPSPTRPDEEFVPEQLRERLLERASEIDAREARVADLRDAATQAGISQRAFDAALEEMRLTRELRTEKRRRTRGMRLLLTFLVSVGLTIAVGAYLVPRSIASTTYTGPQAAPAGTAFLSQEYDLGCLTEPEAIEVLRPLLKYRENLLIRSKAERSLRVTATPAQHDEFQRALHGACAVRATEPTKAP